MVNLQNDLGKSLTRTRHSTRLNKREGTHEQDVEKFQQIDGNYSETYSTMGLEDGNKEYYTNPIKSKPNVGRGGHNRRTTKNDRRVYNNEDEQFSKIVEIFGYFIQD